MHSINPKKRFLLRTLSQNIQPLLFYACAYFLLINDICQCKMTFVVKLSNFVVYCIICMYCSSNAKPCRLSWFSGSPLGKPHQGILWCETALKQVFEYFSSHFKFKKIDGCHMKINSGAREHRRPRHTFHFQPQFVFHVTDLRQEQQERDCRT